MQRPDHTRFERGDVIATRYRVEQELGRGGMGLVLLLEQNRAGVDLRRRLASEARLASGLNHSGIATVFDFVESTEGAFIVYEFVEGRTLRNELTNGPFRAEEFVDAAIQLADALAAAHRQRVIHRDLKPENIMVTPGENGRRMKILDFGLARPFSDPLARAGSEAENEITISFTAPGIMAGTIAYMAPEQLEGIAADERADIYALGLVLYEMATRRHPFRGKSVSSTIANTLTKTAPPLAEVEPATPIEIDRIVRKCLRRPAAERYESLAGLLADLRAFRAISTHAHCAPAEGEPQSLIRKLFGPAATRPYRMWEALHIKMCIRCVLLAFLAWRFRVASTGMWSVGLFFCALLLSSIQCMLSAVMLFFGAMDRDVLLAEIRRFAPWFRVLGIVNGVLAAAMAGCIAEAHTILAAFIALLGAAIGFTAVTFKPSLDSAIARSSG
jgi:hypothetical protein